MGKLIVGASPADRCWLRKDVSHPRSSRHQNLLSCFLFRGEKKLNCKTTHQHTLFLSLPLSQASTHTHAPKCTHARTHTHARAHVRSHSPALSSPPPVLQPQYLPLLPKLLETTFPLPVLLFSFGTNLSSRDRKLSNPWRLHSHSKAFKTIPVLKT